MKAGIAVRLAGSLVALCICPNAVAASAVQIEGLVEVKAKRVDSAWLLPGVDFSPYQKVMIDSAEVAFRKNWVRDVNRNRMRGAGNHVSEKDAAEIAAAARSGFDDIFEAAFKEAGWELATEPAADVLRLRPSIVNLSINSPEAATSGVTRVYSVEAGEATLLLQAHDSLTGALLGVAVDQRVVGDDRGAIGVDRMDWTTRSSNKAEFKSLFKVWANICVKGLQELKERAGEAAPATGEH